MTLAIQRKISSETNTNRQISVDLPRTDVLRALNLRLSVDVTQGAAPATGVLAGGIARILRKIDVVIDGKDTVFSMAGEILRLMNLFDYGTGVSETNVASPAVTGTYTICLTVPFILSGPSRRAIDCALDVRRASSARLNIEWGTVSDIWSTVNNTTISNVTLTIDAETYTNVAQDFKAGVVRRAVIPKLVSATNSDLQEKLSIGLIYRRIMLAMFDASVASNSILNECKLASGSYVFKQVRFYTQRDVNKRVYQLETVPTGSLMLDLFTDGSLAEAINTAGFSDLTLSQDVTVGAGTTYSYIMTEQVEL